MKISFKGDSARAAHSVSEAYLSTAGKGAAKPVGGGDGHSPPIPTNIERLVS
jgi:hypothetical protein